MPVAKIALAAWRVNGDVRRHPITVGNGLREFSRKADALRRRKLGRKRQLIFARHGRVDPLLRRLRRVPQNRTIARPARLGGNDDFGVLAPVCACNRERALPGHIQCLGRAISRRRRRDRPALRETAFTER